MTEEENKNNPEINEEKIPLTGSDENQELDNKSEVENEVEEEEIIEDESDEDTEEVEIADEKEVLEAEEPLAIQREVYKPQIVGDFDWDANTKKAGGYSKEVRAKMEEQYAQTITSVQPSQVMQGKVVAITDRDVVVNIGFKSDGLIALSEFKDNPELKVGDEVEVIVINQEDKNGQLILSRKHAKLLATWQALVAAHENETIITGKVKNRTKGGLVVDVGGIETFLPGSQIDVKPIRDYDHFVGKTMEFKVVKINHILKNAVVSHKALIESDLEAQKIEIISRLEKGQVLEGIVKNMTDFGVFVDLGGVDGLLHITDISWSRVNHPNEVLVLDQKLNVVVLDFDDEKKRISLGMKQLTAHPWDAIVTSIEPGAIVKGKIVNVADYGSFLEIAPGVEGLIHVSEMSWSQHLRNPQDFHSAGDEVSAVVLSIDKEDRKMSLGIKQLTPDPWINITEKYPVGSKHTGIVRNLTNYGMFVELGEGVDGLVHVSDLSWTKKINHPSEFVKKGENLEVVVLEIDVENRRLSIGHKQIEENPWDTFETIFYEGSVHTGTMISMEDKGAIVMLPYGVEGFAPKKQIKRENGKNVVVEEQEEWKIIEFSKDARRIVVSHSRIWEDAKKIESGEMEEGAESAAKAKKKKAKLADAAPNSMTFGNLDVLSEIREKLEASEKEAQQEAIKKLDDKEKKKKD